MILDVTNLNEYQYQISSVRPVEYVIDGFFANRLTLVAGAPGKGKSTVMASLALIAAGLMNVDGITAELRRQVFYVTEDELQLERILYGLTEKGFITAPEAEIHQWFKIVHAQRRPPEEVAAMIAEARIRGRTTHASGYEVEPLIVLDTSNATINLESENDNAETGRAIAAIKESLGNAALWLVGHTAKSLSRAEVSNLSFRGAGAFEGDANAVAYLFAENDDTDVRFLVLGKHRFVAEYREMRIESDIGKVRSVTPWGTAQEIGYCIAIPSRSSARQREASRQAARQDEILADSNRLKRRIVNMVVKETQTGESINRSRLKQLVGGKGQTVSDLIIQLIDEGWLRERKSEGKKGYDLHALKIPSDEDFPIPVGMIRNEVAKQMVANMLGESFPENHSP